MLEVARSIAMRTGPLLHAALGALAGALVVLAPAPSFAGARGLRASHASHGVGAGRHFSHGVEVLRGCGFDAARPGRLGPRPVAHRPLRGVPDPGPRHGFHDPPLVIFVDDGPEVVIDQPGVVIIIE
jgi:hypothetical protein